MLRKTPKPATTKNRRGPRGPRRPANPDLYPRLRVELDFRLVRIAVFVVDRVGPGHQDRRDLHLAQGRLRRQAEEIDAGTVHPEQQALHPFDEARARVEPRVDDDEARSRRRPFDPQLDPVQAGLRQGDLAAAGSVLLRVLPDEAVDVLGRVRPLDGDGGRVEGDADYQQQDQDVGLRGRRNRPVNPHQEPAMSDSPQTPPIVDEVFSDYVALLGRGGEPDLSDYEAVREALRGVLVPEMHRRGL